METITLLIDQAARKGHADRYMGGLTVEAVKTSPALPEGAKLALYIDDVLCAAGTLDASGACELDTNTQQIADAFRGLPAGYEREAVIYLGDADNLLAIVRATVRRNWLEDAAHYPPVAPDVYPTEAELQAWLTQARQLAADIAEVAQPALSAADAAKQSAEAAQRYASAAGEPPGAAVKAAQDAATYQGNAQAAAQVAQQARDNAQLQQQQATQQAANARSSATEAKNAQNRAQWAQEDAEKARDAAKLAADNAAESENAARQFSQEAANAATGATQAWEDVAAFYGDLLEAAGLDANQLESQAAKAAGMEDA